VAPPPAETVALRAWRGVRERTREIVDRAKNEHATPHEVGLSVAVGAFSACTPFLGLHMWIALGLATVFRLNRLWAFLASRISIMPVYLWISFCEIELGHRLRAGEWLHVGAREALSRGMELSTDWAAGTALVGGFLAAALGLAAYACARRWSAAHAAPALSVTPRRLDGPLERSSESPPSEPRGSSP
jgi:uncharacterized protein (DUF2062 family)